MISSGWFWCKKSKQIKSSEKGMIIKHHQKAIKIRCGHWLVRYPTRTLERPLFFESQLKLTACSKIKFVHDPWVTDCNWNIDALVLKMSVKLSDIAPNCFCEFVQLINIETIKFWNDNITGQTANTKSPPIKSKVFSLVTDFIYLRYHIRW